MDETAGGGDRNRIADGVSEQCAADRGIVADLAAGKAVENGSVLYTFRYK